MTHRDWFNSKTESGRVQLSDWGGSMPDGEFNNKTLRFAQLLADRFPERRSRIGLWGENSLDYMIALFAVLRAGHVAVPLNTRLAARELVDVARATEIVGLLAAREFPEPYRSALNALDILPIAPRLAAADIHERVKIRELGDKDVAVLLCSSGSSGKVKIVPHTLMALIEHAKAVCSHLSVTWKDSWVCCLPFYHIGGLAIPFRCLASGAALVISRSADPDDLNRLIDMDGVTLVSVVPTVLERMLNKHSGPWPKTLRAIVVGGGPVPAPLLDRCEAAFPTYGLTEAGSMVTCARPGKGDAERKTAGVPLPGTDVRIVNEAGKEKRAGEQGLILMRGPGMAQTYLGDKETSAKTFKGGWVHTGDLGHLDDKGRLIVHARRQDLVVSGGENIYPAEIEAALKEHARVAAVVVLPIEDPQWGQSPAAFIVLSPGRPLEKVHMFYHLEGRLARHKFPKTVVFADALPTLGNGKPDLVAIKKALLEKSKGK